MRLPHFSSSWTVDIDHIQYAKKISKLCQRRSLVRMSAVYPFGPTMLCKVEYDTDGRFVVTVELYRDNSTSICNSSNF